MNVAVARVNMKNHFYGLAIGRVIVMKNHFYDLACGHVIVARAYGAGAASGGCFNVAVAIGLYTIWTVPTLPDDMPRAPRAQAD